MTTFRAVLALILILMVGTTFAAPKGGGDSGPTDLMRGLYYCGAISLDNDYRFEVNVNSATFINSNKFSNDVNFGSVFDCATHLEQIAVLASAYCQTDYLSAAYLRFVCKGSREEMVGLLADMQESVMNP